MEAVKIEPFEMERWQSLHEHDVELNLSDSGVHPLSLRELLELCEERDALEDLLEQRLEYTRTNGTPELRERIAALYPDTTPAEVEVTVGGAEANCVAAWSLIEPGDEVVAMLPNYGQLPGLARGLGARVVPWELRRTEAGWEADPAELEELVTPRTRMVFVCTPNNPTGAVLDEDALEEVARVADRHGAWVLSDEVYAGTELDGESAPSLRGRGKRVIVTNSLSKACGLPGLRLGWIVAPESAIEAFWARHDYTTIGPAALSDLLAERALRPANRARLLERARGHLRANHAFLADWAASRTDVEHVPPRAGAVAWLRCRTGGTTRELAERLRVEHDVLVVPGEHFGQEGWLRIGVGGERRVLEEGLRRLGTALAG